MVNASPKNNIIDEDESAAAFAGAPGADAVYTKQWNAVKCIHRYLCSKTFSGWTKILIELEFPLSLSDAKRIEGQ